MARQPRLQYQGALYHVTTRGNRRERIVHDDRDYARLEKVLLEAMAYAQVKLYAWCFMLFYAAP
jgi:putative transposase